MKPATPFFMSFAQFLAAPRTGKLLDELRRLPKRPLTPDEVLAANEIEEAKAALRVAGIDHVPSNQGQAHYLKGNKAKIWRRYQQAWENWSALQSVMRESQQRWIYNEAVKSGVIISPTIEPDPVGEIEKSEKKADREKQAEADKLLPESVEAPDSFSVEDAALDYAENAMGRFYFAEHWAKHRNLASVTTWLKNHDYLADPVAVLEELDRIAQSGLWRS